MNYSTYDKSLYVREISYLYSEVDRTCFSKWSYIVLTFWQKLLDIFTDTSQDAIEILLILGIVEDHIIARNLTITIVQISFSL